MTAPTERLQHLADVSRGMDDPLDVGYYECCALATEMLSAIQCLREIAAMGKKAGSETAQHWLLQHGYPIEEGGYVPGAQGFGDAR